MNEKDSDKRIFHAEKSDGATCPCEDLDKIVGLGLTQISVIEQDARRRAVEENRADFALEGIAEPLEIARLSELFILGDLTPAQYRAACFDYAKSLAMNKSWTPITGPLTE